MNSDLPSHLVAFLVPTDAEGFVVKEYLWTFNMPTDHARISLNGVRVPGSAIFGGEGRGLAVVQRFFNENPILFGFMSHRAPKGVAEGP